MMIYESWIEPRWEPTPGQVDVFAGRKAIPSPALRQFLDGDPSRSKQFLWADSQERQSDRQSSSKSSRGWASWDMASFLDIQMGVSENGVYPIVPNGFADQTIPMKNG